MYRWKGRWTDVRIHERHRQTNNRLRQRKKYTKVEKETENKGTKNIKKAT
jgi:NDP-sugar pyrophosphorylase family protein